MQARWPWLSRSDHSRPWKEFNIQVPKESMQIFRSAAIAAVGQGTETLF